MSKRRIADPKRPGSITGEILALQRAVHEMLDFVTRVELYADRAFLAEEARELREKYENT